MKRQRIRRAILLLSFLLFPVTLNYFSPALMIQGTMEGVAVASLFFWSFWFLLSLFLGRAGCGYFCPLGGLQMIGDRVSGIKLKRVKNIRFVKYLIWTLWIILVIHFVVSAGGWGKINFFYNMPTGVSVDSVASLATYFGMLLLVLLPLLLGKRAFCHYFCFFAPYNIIGSKIMKFLSIPALRLDGELSKCINCQACEKACPMSLEVREMVHRGSMSNTECILCGSCVDSCPKGVINYCFSRGLQKKNNGRTNLGGKIV